MKVGYLVEQFPVLSETFIRDQLVGTASRGHEVSVFAYAMGDQPVEHDPVIDSVLTRNTHYARLPANRFRNAASIAALLIRTPRLSVAGASTVRRLGLRRAVQLLHFQTAFIYTPTEELDVLHAHFGPRGLDAVDLRNLGVFQAPIVTSFHGYDTGAHPAKYGREVYRRLFAEGEAFVANSEFTASRLRRLGCPTDRIWVQPLGVDLEKLDPFPRNHRERPLRVLTVARLSEEKGIEYGIRAVAEAARSIEGGIDYTIVGAGPERDRLGAMVEALGCGDHVHFTGPLQRAQTASAFRNAHIFLLPSVRTAGGAEEGAGLVIAEAQAAGLPVIASAIGGIPEMLAPDITGFLVSERSPSEIAARLIQLAQAPDEVERMGAAARRLAEQRFDGRRLAEELESLYHRVVRGPL